jgi:hypothetical protein
MDSSVERPMLRKQRSITHRVGLQARASLLAFGSTSWQLDFDTYEAWASSWSYGLDIYKSANGYGTNIYHSGSALDQALCDAGGYSSCSSNTVYLCTTDGYPAGCGNYNTRSWYMTTYHYFDNSQTYFEVWTATTSELGRESYSCWSAMNCLY